MTTGRLFRPLCSCQSMSDIAATDGHPLNPILVVFLGLASFVLSVGLLVVGKPIILPVLASGIAVYVLHACVEWVRGFPVLQRVPRWMISVAVLSIFVACVLLMGLVVAVTLEEMVDRSTTYQATLEGMIGQLATRFGVEGDPDWQDIRQATIGRLDLPTMLRSLFNSLTSFGTMLFLIIVYSGFLMTEIGRFPAKIDRAFPTEGRSGKIITVARDINRNIGDYLFVKTAINVLLGLLSYAVLWAFGVDFALFWAVLIGLFNYIPYLGSWLGVAFPVILSVAQFGDLWQTLLLTVALTILQLVMGSVVEPRWIGRQLNLSPFVVMLALAFWSALWGLAGAILAVPLTSAFVIIFSAFPDTRPIAILVSDALGDDPEEDRAR
ncbi:AI-2E family transporter [Chachezhania sediminis]|uniref:AI-2E family transporter n=1 Tax=Chachezhania sediminis TaxID=2599291 RepID=UPI00131A6A71|nr:AI-2E family transporter [Chachezhania sediminis]